MRIAQRQLLGRGTDCITLATGMGFCDQSHFTRAFKELSGGTPSSYSTLVRDGRVWSASLLFFAERAIVVP